MRTKHLIRPRSWDQGTSKAGESTNYRYLGRASKRRSRTATDETMIEDDQMKGKTYSTRGHSEPCRPICAQSVQPWPEVRGSHRARDHLILTNDSRYQQYQSITNLARFLDLQNFWGRRSNLERGRNIENKTRLGFTSCRVPPHCTYFGTNKQCRSRAEACICVCQD
jgi:hypothetical protein